MHAANVEERCAIELDSLYRPPPFSPEMLSRNKQLLKVSLLRRAYTEPPRPRVPLTLSTASLPWKMQLVPLSDESIVNKPAPWSASVAKGLSARPPSTYSPSSAAPLIESAVITW